MSPQYIVEIIKSYLQDTLIMFGAVRKDITCGVPQDSVIGPTLWNVMYDGLLELPVLREVELVSFADDIAIVAMAHNKELVKSLVDPVLSSINVWMTADGLQVAPHKSEAVLLIKK